MASSCNNIILLFLCQADELNSVTGNADCEVCVLFLLRMSLRIKKLLSTEYVYIQVMSALIEVAVKNLYKVANALFLAVAKSIRVDRLGIGDTVKRPVVRNLCNRVQGSNKTVCFCTVAWACTRAEWCVSGTSVWHSAGCLTINDIGGNGKKGRGRLGIAVGVAAADLLHKGL